MNENIENAGTRTPPAITDCRASDIGLIEMGECLQAGPNSCSYALPFGYCFLCRHPRLREIISNTQKADPAVAMFYHD